MVIMSATRTEGWLSTAAGGHCDPALLGVCLLVAGWTGAAQAMEISRVAPQGEVSRIQNLVVGFKAAVSALGDARLPDPVRLTCSAGVPVHGQGRWTNEREWVFEFQQPLPAGARCTVQTRDDFVPTAPGVDPSWQGARQFNFNLAAPSVQQVRPSLHQRIEEHQHFLLRLSGQAAEGSVAAGMWCESKALGERIAVRLLPDKARDELLKQLKLNAGDGPWLLVGCQRPLPAGSEMALVWGPGIAAQVDETVRTRREQRFRFQVRQPLVAEFSCERERANMPCLPVRPLRLNFSEAVPRAQALALRLKAADGRLIAPQTPKDEADEGEGLRNLSFPSPLPEQAQFQLQLPAGIKDLSGRPLSNAASFPMTVATGAAPPLAKFAAAPFGIIEWEREGPSLVPLSLRHLQRELRDTLPGRGASLQVKRIGTANEALSWYARLQRADQQEWGSRKTALLRGESGLQTLQIPVPAAAASQPEGSVEMLGVPLAQPGYHVLELASPRLGQALLDPAQTMYVRTGVLVTNLGLHFKLGRENSLIWVTSLDKGQPVADAQVTVADCFGKPLWRGRSDAQGLARVEQALTEPRWDSRCPADTGLFISASVQQPGRAADMAFMFSSWSRGIESWRFNVPTDSGPEQRARAHTVLDRPLLRAGDTLSMKHFFRLESLQGLQDAKAQELPDQLRMVFEGTGEDVLTQPLHWLGTRYALSSWKVPQGAKLGRYRLVLERRSGGEAVQRSWDSGSVRVEEFRVPLVDARLLPPDSTKLAGANEQAWGLQLNYQAGGPMAQAPVQVSALLRPRWLRFAGYDDYAFEPPSRQPVPGEGDWGGEGQEGEGMAEPAGAKRLLLDKLALRTDAQGAARFKLPMPPGQDRPSELRVEMSYRDPDGQIHTKALSQPVWPAAQVLGLRAPSWAAHGQRVIVQAVVLDLQGRPLQGRSVLIQARQLQTLSTRKRLVGGFYAYEHQSKVNELGELCRGQSDAQGLMRCEAVLQSTGQIELIAQGADPAGRVQRAARSLWVTRAGELWFAQDNDDRIDVLPERRQWQPGETARLQVRMPYREALALVSVEREGILHAELQRLSGRDPWVQLKIAPDWGPNVYVSVLVLRGRLREVPWYSFFSWGWRAPLDWWREWRASGDYQPPTAMVDLAKPSFKLGMAALEVGAARHQLRVEVLPQQPQYGVRQTAQVQLRVTQNGQPVPQAQIAFAAVDEGLLSLAPNPSWQLLDGLLRSRPWGVQTASAHSEIVGRRHYGRKAVAAGGGGGTAARELFDTLLTWQPAVTLDSRGEALVQVPLNDALTRFRLVAVADAPGQRFGTGEGSVAVSQDLQLLSGLPPLVREGDQFQAMLTVRNASARPMDLDVRLQARAGSGASAPAGLAPQRLQLAAGQARELAWSVKVPEGASRLDWEAQAQDLTPGQGAPARDLMRISQAVQAAVPLRVWQASLRQLEGGATIPVAAPADALPAQGAKRGGLQMAWQARLSDGLPGVKRYFEHYPYSCLEQQGSRLLALQDRPGWEALMGQIASYQDGDGLLAYFPLSDGYRQGSDVLTAYLLSAAQESGLRLPELVQRRALDGLAAFVEGRLERRHWSPRADEVARRVAALAALARYGRAQPRQLATVDARQLAQWPSATLIDWLVLHQRLTELPQREAQIAAASNQLRARLSYAGSTLRFVNEEADAWWWLMDSADSNALRLILAVHADPTWREDLPRLVTGALARQQRGAWATTTANLWGVLALQRFSASFESQPVTGRSRAQLGVQQQVQDWQAQPKGGSQLLPWSVQPVPLLLSHEGGGRPWVSVQALAAVPLKTPLSAGYVLKRSVTAVSQKAAPAWSRGDVLRVRLEIEAAADMSWVVITDPLPSGAAVLQGGLDNADERREGQAWPAYVERSFSAWRAYFAVLPQGRQVLEYTLRLNNAGRFQLPGARVEAMYAPDRIAELPFATLEVAP
jgi:uncharacterized protein YfaS (alpha-2-macroglobulin family)